MKKPEKRWIVLLRAIGPTTHKVMPMAQLRAGCEDAGFVDVRTVLATGNLLVSSAKGEGEVRDAVRSVVHAHGLDNEVFVRTPAEMQAVIASNPLPNAACHRPNHLLVLFLNDAPNDDGIEALKAYEGPERAIVHGREVFIDYKEGVGRSKLTAAALERRLGRSGTARNWNTACRLIAETR